MNVNASRDRTRIYDTALVVFGVAAIWAAWIGIHRANWLLAIIAFFALACMLYGVFIEAKFFVVRRYRESLVPEPKTWIRLIFLSDFHAGGSHPASWYERLALETQALDPDILILGGDFVVDKPDHIADLISLTNIRAHIGRYFVLGNHDLLDNPSAVRRALTQWGIVDLTNAHLAVTKEGRSLQLSGLDDHWHGRPDVPPIRGLREVPHVTIAHEPDAILDFTEGDTDLILSGHTHGGQIRLPLIGPLWKLPCTIGRRGDRGRRITNGVRHIISAGCSETDMRARFLCPSEIVLLEMGI